MRKSKDKSVFATLLVMVGLLLVLVFLFLVVDGISHDRCSQTMQDVMRNTKVKIQDTFTEDRQVLRTLADVVADYDGTVDNEQTASLVKNFKPHTISSRIAVLLPNNELLTVAGRIANSGISFAKEAELGAHLEDPRHSVVDGRLAVRNFVPVMKNGVTVAMLYGVVLLDDLAQKWSYSSYHGDDFINIVDPQNNWLVLDTLHKRYGDLGEHNDLGAVLDSVLAGNTGESSAYLEEFQEKAYVCYEPLGISDWNLVLFVRESQAFAEVTRVRNTLVLVDLMAMMILAYYLVWMKRYSKKNSKSLEEINRQLTAANNNIRSFRMKETDLRDELKRSNYQAEHDMLTRLLNRGAYDALMQQLKDSGEDYALLLMDVDHFKAINDNHGHSIGDQVLVELGDLLKTQFRDTDYPCRIGGDEFAVIMLGINDGHRPVIERKANQINEALANPGNHLPPCSVSIGVAMSRHCQSEDIYAAADAALYRAKKRGRQCHVFFQE